MRAAACIPFRPVDDDRAANLERTRQTYDALGWPVYLGDHDGDPFSRGVAINVAVTNALREAPDLDVVFLCDSDVLMPNPERVEEAAALAVARGCYVVGYTDWVVLDWEGTYQARNGDKPGEEAVLEVNKGCWLGSGALPVWLWQAVGGFDPRFVGYGHEDLGFLPAVGTLGRAPKERVGGHCYHLQHPPNEEREFFLGNARLASRYRGCDDDPDAMRALLAERAVL